ncbi:hypothetical protein HS088_TW12G00253 [Tripterygium wilfordii]|uniref:Mediator complex subunit 15 KIX domain-containing protein n=1 Tax=Tripterygium wilfordii TaxID=458696 RepID=A0A7J7CY75_TRIWF|nr:hypothetical protein HS088_TW12G00253 [Tripterygium wilfordii]
MDTNNSSPPPAGDTAVDTGDWRAQLAPDYRQRIVNKIMETLKRHLPFTGQEGLQELKKIAERFEEKIYFAAESQKDYLRKISLKMLTMESKSQNTVPNPLQSNSPSNNNSNKPPNPVASHNMQSQLHNQGQSLPMQLPSSQQARQELLSQNTQNNIASAGLAMSSVAGLSQAPIPNVVSQNFNMQNISNVSQSSVGNSMGQGMPSNMFTNSLRPMAGRQQVVGQQQQPQRQSQNTQHYLYQQQLLMKQKFLQGNLPHSLVQSHIQQQQNILQPTQLQSSQQSGMQTSSMVQPSLMQSAPLFSRQQNQQSPVQQSTHSMLQQHQQQILRLHQQPQQTAVVHQQLMAQRTLLHPQ